MTARGFPVSFYSKEPLPTTTVLIKDKDSNLKHPKITWSTRVVASENEGILSAEKKTLSPYNDNDEGLLLCTDLEGNYEIWCTKSGKFKTSIYIPSVLLPTIVGPKGSQLRQLQENTQTSIKVPRSHEINAHVKITGNTERNVASACNQINILTLSKREKMASTHFISIPMNSDDIKKNFETFKKKVLDGGPIRGVDETIFQNPNKLHITVDVFTLLDEFEIDRAKDMLFSKAADLFGLYLPKNKYAVRLRGLEIMNDDPTEVDVLYAEVQMENETEQKGFQTFVDQISHMFYVYGFVRKQNDYIKLHVTLMNSLFRKDENVKRKTFDASFILKKYKNYDFGATVLDKIDLSIRFSTAANGYYKSEISVPLKHD